MNLVTKITQISLFTLLALQSLHAAEKQWETSYTLEAKGQYAKAATALNGLKDNEFIQLRLAWLNYQQANYNVAKALYKKALATNPHSVDAKLGLVKALLVQQRWLEAEKYNNKILVDAPLNMTAQLNQLAIDEHNKAWNKLQQHAQYLSNRFPTSTDALVYLARAYLWLNDKAKAKQTYKQVLQRYPANLEAQYYLKNN